PFAEPTLQQAAALVRFGGDAYLRRVAEVQAPGAVVILAFPFAHARAHQVDRVGPEYFAADGVHPIADLIEPHANRVAFLDRLQKMNVTFDKSCRLRPCTDRWWPKFSRQSKAFRRRAGTQFHTAVLRCIGG